MRRELHPCIYILTNKGHRVRYTGVTSNLFKRVSEHKQKLIPGFTSRYNVTKLVYYEEFNTMEEAIAREKQIKGGSRQQKIDLIKGKNAEWKDLYDEFFACYIVITSLREPISQGGSHGISHETASSTCPSTYTQGNSPRNDGKLFERQCNKLSPLL